MREATTMVEGLLDDVIRSQSSRILRRAEYLKSMQAMVAVAGASVPAVALCGTRTLRGPGILPMDRDGRLSFANLEVCHRSKTCPNCGLAHLYGQRCDLTQALWENAERGGSAAFVTLTARFPQETVLLSERLKALRVALGHFNGSRSVKAARRTQGRFGAVRVVHPVARGHLWHVHLHFLYFFDRALQNSDLKKLELTETDAWGAAAARAGLRAEADAQDYQLIAPHLRDLERVAAYVTKGIEEITRPWNATVSAADCALMGRSPWVLLRDAALATDGLAADLFAEWSTQSRNFASFYWSKGLRSVLLHREETWYER